MTLPEKETKKSQRPAPGPKRHLAAFIKEEGLEVEPKEILAAPPPHSPIPEPVVPLLRPKELT